MPANAVLFAIVSAIALHAHEDRRAAGGWGDDSATGPDRGGSPSAPRPAGPDRAGS
jgi:hypothetical protein